MSSESYTFEVNKVKLAGQRRAVVDASTLLTKRLRRAPEACSPGAYLDSEIHPLVTAVGCAYNEHRPLALSPDAIWLTITQGLALHIEANPEALRHHFVQHEGKKHLEVERDGFIKGDPSNDWPGAFAEFSEMIQKDIGKKHDLIVSDFSTTTPTSKAASEVVLMDAMKAYFSYGMTTMCGFPSITLEGTQDDWDSLYLRTSYLAEFGLQWWLDSLLPVLTTFCEARRGKVDKAFWGRAYHIENGSGGARVSGWVNAFFPYHEAGTGGLKAPIKNDQVEWTKARSWGGNHFDAYPSGIAMAPMRWLYYGQVFPMQLLGGLVGVEQRPDGALSPGIGWAVMDAPTEPPPDDGEKKPKPRAGRIAPPIPPLPTSTPDPTVDSSPVERALAMPAPRDPRAQDLPPPRTGQVVVFEEHSRVSAPADPRGARGWFFGEIPGAVLSAGWSGMNAKAIAAAMKDPIIARPADHDQLEARVADLAQRDAYNAHDAKVAADDDLPDIDDTYAEETPHDQEEVPVQTPEERAAYAAYLATLPEV